MLKQLWGLLPLTIVELVLLLAMYVLLNLAFVFFVPVLQGVTVEFQVTDAITGEPLADVEIGRPSLHHETLQKKTYPIGRTDQHGRLHYSELSPRRVYWAWPRVRSGEPPMQLRGEIWAEKEGYALFKIDLNEATDPVPVGDSTPVVVRMKREIN